MKAGRVARLQVAGLANVGQLLVAEALCSTYFFVEQYNYKNCILTGGGVTRPDGLVVMTFRLHRKGHRFDPGSGYRLPVSSILQP